MKRYSHNCRVQSVYNIRYGTWAGWDMTPELDAIFRAQPRAFKVNASVGVLLRNNSTGRLRYWHASANNARIFSEPYLVQSRQDFDEFVRALSAQNLARSALDDAEDSEWTLHDVTNVSIYVNHLNFAIRANVVDGRAGRRQGALDLTTDSNACFFYCLAAHRNRDKVKSGHIYLNREMKAVYRRVCQTPLQLFPGVTMDDMDFLEKKFDVGVQIYNAEQSDFAYLVRRASPAYADVMHLDLSDAGVGKPHFKYIYDLKAYSPYFKCGKCSQLWKYSSQCARHEATCDTQTKRVYPDKYYSVDPTVFEKMADLGIWVPHELRLFPHFITYDFESMMVEDPSQKFDAKHVPISFSACSNIPGLTRPAFRAHRDPAQLISTFVALLEEWSLRSYELLKPRYRHYLSQLENASKRVRERERSCGRTFKTPDAHGDLLIELESWLKQTVVLGFNSQNYDLNVIKPYLLRFLMRRENTPRLGDDDDDEDDDDDDDDDDEDDDERPARNLARDPRSGKFRARDLQPSWGITDDRDGEPPAGAPPAGEFPKRLKARIVKRNNSLMCVATDRLRLLDISNYLAPTSYSGYLKAFKIPEQKGYFCYEYLKRFDQLYETRLPPYECFFSTLKGKNTLDGEGDEERGRRVWQDLDAMWKRKGMSNLMDFLKWYNDLDVTSFVEAVKVQQSLFWKHLGVDIFKEGISLPGISLKYAMKTTDAKFALYGEKFKWLHSELREGVVGGPSIVFTRYHEKDVTKIRAQTLGERAKTCKAVVGVDANSLYLWAWAQDFPCGDFEVRLGPKFALERRSSKGFSQDSIRWLDIEAKERKIHITHLLNSEGGEVRIGSSKYRVDGFCADQRLCFEFNGCFYHACERCNADRMDDIHPYYPLTFAEVRERTRKKAEYLEHLGYGVVTKWECDFNREHPPPKKPKKVMTEQVILNMVRTGELFGLVKVDIMTPDHLKDRLDEFPAIFKNCDVGIDDVSPLMRRYCEKNKKLTKPTRLLISSHKADRVLLITPLLKYYLELGLRVTKVHYTVHFPDHKPCFRAFADKVCEARRQGDKDPDSEVLANTFKLVGNSAYGKITMNKTKQTDTVYANGLHATHLMNRSRFKACAKVDDDLFEVELYKRKHVFNLPLHLGVFVYGYAKLRMCQWTHQFMQRYLHRDSYELVEMDTDSSYFGLARPTIDECVRPHLLHDYYDHYDEWFPTLACAVHRQAFVDAKTAGRVWHMSKCCREAHKYDKRTPGKFKIEFQGEGVVALCSKTYVCFGGEHGNETKLSCKGIQKRNNIQDLTKEAYLAVLRNQTAGSGVNKGFVARNGGVYSYTQTRRGLSYMYCKRLVLDDGVSTMPLDL